MIIVNQEEKASVILTELKTEWENLYFFFHQEQSDFLLSVESVLCPSPELQILTNSFCSPSAHLNLDSFSSLVLLSAESSHNWNFV